MVIKAVRRDVANHPFESPRHHLGDHKVRQGDAIWIWRTSEMQCGEGDKRKIKKRRKGKKLREPIPRDQAAHVTFPKHDLELPLPLLRPLPSGGESISPSLPLPFTSVAASVAPLLRSSPPLPLTFSNAGAAPFQIPLHSMQIESCWPAAAPLTSLMLQLAGEESWHGHVSRWGWGEDRSLAFPESCWSSSSSSSFFSLPSSLVLLDFGRGTPRNF